MARRRATYEDLRALPDHLVGELIGGELFVSPRPAVPHALAASAIGADVLGPFQRGRGGPGGWWILDEPELHLDGDVLVPDLAGWRRERMPTLPNVPALDLVPDWVCEVVSPSTARLDRGQKTALYARLGVAHLWIVDPLAQTLETYRQQGGQWLLLGTHCADARARVEPFDAIELDLAPWWTEAVSSPG